MLSFRERLLSGYHTIMYLYKSSSLLLSKLTTPLSVTQGNKIFSRCFSTLPLPFHEMNYFSCVFIIRLYLLLALPYHRNLISSVVNDFYGYAFFLAITAKARCTFTLSPYRGISFLTYKLSQKQYLLLFQPFCLSSSITFKAVSVASLIPCILFEYSKTLLNNHCGRLGIQSRIQPEGISLAYR